MISKNRLAVAAISAGLVTSLLGMGAAQADPVGAPTPRALTGVGSDTTQDVMNQVAKDVKDSGGNALIGSWNATDGTANPSTFDTGKAGCSAVPRPNGSGAGRTALLNSLAAGDGCIQFSRSSSLNLAAAATQLTYVPFAVDAVSYAVTSDSGISRKLTLANLQAMYHCTASAVGTGPNYSVTPVLPQAGSGTRSYWETQMGITDADVNANLYPCIYNGSKNGTLIEEHTGTALDSKSIEPFSIGQFNSQANGTISDKRGKAVLGSIDGFIPQLTNGGFEIKRDVFNVIPTSQTGVSPYSDVFVGAGSKICADTATILKYGFAVNPSCGDISQHTP